MPVIFKKYGPHIEITHYEKNPHKVRVPITRKRPNTPRSRIKKCIATKQRKRKEQNNYL